MNYKIKYIECECYTPEHTLRFMFDEDDDCVYVETFIKQHNSFIKRLYIAFRYIFNIKTCDNYSGSMIFKPKIKELRDELTKFLRKIK